MGTAEHAIVYGSPNPAIILINFDVALNTLSEWQKAKTESEKDGSLLAKAPESVYMTPTDYSPLK